VSGLDVRDEGVRGGSITSSEVDVFGLVGDKCPDRLGSKTRGTCIRCQSGVNPMTNMIVPPVTRIILPAKGGIFVAGLKLLTPPADLCAMLVI
jgi:hypothetical protein